MELYNYKCPVCGFIHQVPAYWVSFSPEETYEFPHMDTSTGTLCDNPALEFMETICSE